MSVTLKRVMGEAGALLDDSTGYDNLYDILKGLVDFQTDVVAQFNQFRTDYNATTSPTTATALAVEVVAE